MSYRKSVLDSGLRVVSEFHPQSRAVALGVWVMTGTRDEKKDEAGISHLLEHMVFKATKTRSAYQISKSLESLGGELNAYTTREYTCYHAYVLKDHWKQALDVLADLVCHMDVSRSDFLLEKSVVAQEISMVEDQLEELSYDLYLEQSLGSHPLGRPILGNPESIAKMKQSQLISCYKNRYVGPNLILSVAGSLEHQDLVEAAEHYFKSKKKKSFRKHRERPKHKSFFHAVAKETEQTHLLMGFPCTSFKDSHRFEAFVLNALLGGGMTSKLYQSLREKRGLVYTVYSALNTFDDFGLINVYAACAPENMPKVIKTLRREIAAVRERKLTQGQLEMFKTQIIGSLLLGAEDMESRMTSLGVNEMVFEEYKPVDAIVEEIRELKLKNVKDFIDQYLNLEDAGLLLVGAQADQIDG